MWSRDFGISGPQLFHNVFLCCARSKCIFEVVVFVSLTFYDVCHCCMSTPDISWREVTDFMRATSVWSI